MRERAQHQPPRMGMGAPAARRLLAVLPAFALVTGMLFADCEALAQGANEARRNTEFSAQSRPRTRVLVQPGYPYRRYSTDYPVPYPYEYPGPNGVRQCKARLVQEMRPSGPTVVPRMNCWWEVR